MIVIQNLIKKHAILFLHICCAIILCTILVLFEEKYSDYLLFMNLIFSLSLVYCVYIMIFKKVYANAFLKIICILSMIITANKLYSYNRLLKLFPWISHINSNWWIFVLTLILIAILFIFKLLTYIDLSNETQFKNTQYGIQKKDLYKSNKDDKGFISYNQEQEAFLLSKLENSQKEMFSFLRFLGVFLGLGIMILIPVVLLYAFNKYELDKKELDFDKIFLFIVSYGASFLLILFALVIVIITLIYITKYIYRQINSINKHSNEETEIPTYAFSVVLVCVLLFFSWRVTDFSIDDLTETLIIGDYLALPIAVMVTMISFFLLVQITHAIILMLSKLTASDIKKFIEKQENKFQIMKRVLEIIQNIVNIILDTVLYTLKFVSFIPNFFRSLSLMVFEEDEVSGDDKSQEN